ncbi:MAG: hypothetical protein QM723_11570 [Myxococcaceae bacterium]
MRGLTGIAVLLAAMAYAEKPATLVARTTKVELFVPVQRETWTLRIDDADHAVLERVQEAADPPVVKPADKLSLADATARAEPLLKGLKWKASLTEKYEGSVTRGKERFVLQLGTVKLDCSARKFGVRSPAAKLVVPPGKKCGDLTLKWADGSPTKVEVTKCMLRGGDDSLESQLSFGEVPGIEHVIEEDDCASGDGLKLLGPK